MALNLPFVAKYSFRYQISIEGESYVFVFKWMERSKSFYLTITTSNGTVIQKNAKLLPNEPLITRNRELAPSGQIYLIRTGENLPEITKDSIGPDKEYNLIYFTRAELDAAGRSGDAL